MRTSLNPPRVDFQVWVSAGDIVLVGLRDFQDDKCDIIHKVLRRPLFTI